MTRATVLLLFALLPWQQPGVADDTGKTSQPLPVTEHSESYVRALQLYTDGRYREAARRAEATRSSSGLALAARATLAHALTLDTDETRLSGVRHAANLARTAIHANRRNAEAYRLLAICLGHIARAKPTIENLLDGSPSDAKAAIDRALALEPHSPWGHAVLGGWHAEIVAIAGPIIARQMFGASRYEAKTEFETAIALESRNPVLHYEYAMALQRMDYAEDKRLLCWHYDAAASLPGRDALERTITAKARDKVCSRQ